MANRFRNIPRQERLFRDESIFVPKEFIETNVPKKYIDTNVPERYVPKPLTELSKMYEEAQKRGEKQLEAEDHANTVLGAIKGLQQVETYDQHLGVNDHNEVKSTIEEYKKRLNDITNSYVAADPERNRKLKEFSNEVSNNISSGRLSHILENAKTYQEMKDAIAKAKQNDADYNRNRHVYDAMEKELYDYAANGGTYGKDGTLRKLESKPIGTAVDKLTVATKIGEHMQPQTKEELLAAFANGPLTVQKLPSGHFRYTNAQGLEVSAERIKEVLDGAFEGSDLGKSVRQEAKHFENKAIAEAKARGEEYKGKFNYNGRLMDKDEYIEQEKADWGQYLVGKFEASNIKGEDQIVAPIITKEDKAKAAAKKKALKPPPGNSGYAEGTSTTAPLWQGVDTKNLKEVTDANGNKSTVINTEGINQMFKNHNLSWNTKPDVNNTVGTALDDTRELALDRTVKQSSNGLYATYKNINKEKAIPKENFDALLKIVLKKGLAGDNSFYDKYFRGGLGGDTDEAKEIMGYMIGSNPSLSKYAKTEESKQANFIRPILQIVNMLRSSDSNYKRVVEGYETEFTKASPREFKPFAAAINKESFDQLQGSWNAVEGLVQDSKNFIVDSNENKDDVSGLFAHAKNNWDYKGITNLQYSPDGELVATIRYEGDKDSKYEKGIYEDAPVTKKDFRVKYPGSIQGANFAIDLAEKLVSLPGDQERKTGIALGSAAALILATGKNLNQNIIKVVGSLPSYVKGDNVKYVRLPLTVKENAGEGLEELGLDPVPAEWKGKRLSIFKTREGNNSIYRVSSPGSNKVVSFMSQEDLYQWLALTSKETAPYIDDVTNAEEASEVESQESQESETNPENTKNG